MLDPRVLCGLKAFNAGQFFLAHEIWEEVWRESLPPVRNYYQALIQAAVALYHLQRGNSMGARRLADRALARLSNFDRRYLGLDTRRLRRYLEQILTGELIGQNDQEVGRRCRSDVPNPLNLPVLIEIIDETVEESD